MANYNREINEYRVYGNAALKMMPRTKGRKRSDIEILPENARKKQKKASMMTAGYVFFLSLSLLAVVTLCGFLIMIQSDVTAKIKEVNYLESQLTDLTLSNEEEYARIMGAVDLENIKKIAMEDLGMRYPDESQVVNFEDSDSDYVRQYGNIPQ